MLKVGQTAPTFVLPDADLELFDSAGLRGKNHLVVFFYPKDDTPGCTLQATDFSDHEEDFLRRDSVIVGINCDDSTRHAYFRDKHGLAIRLLTDEGAKICRRYGVWQEKEVDGIRKFGIVRSTFIIDKQGVVRHALYGVNPRGHALDVLQLVKELKA